MSANENTAREHLDVIENILTGKSADSWVKAWIPAIREALEAKVHLTKAWIDLTISHQKAVAQNETLLADVVAANAELAECKANYAALEAKPLVLRNAHNELRAVPANLLEFAGRPISEAARFQGVIR